MLVTMLFGAVAFGTVRAFADDTENTEDGSFYRISCAAAEYYELTHIDYSNQDIWEKIGDAFTGKSGWKDVQWEGDRFGWKSAGSFLAYIDPNYADDGVVGIISSWTSNASSQRSYSSLVVGNDEKLRQYAEYGHALSQLGIDSTSGEASSILDAILRVVIGFCLGLGYLIAAFVSLIWYLVLWLLRIFNPFQWIASGVSAFLNTNVDYGGALTEFPVLAGISSLFKDWYNILANFGVWCVTFTFLAVFLLCLMHGNSGRHNADGKTQTMLTVIVDYLKKLAFIVVGIPLLGLAYTASLDYMATASAKTPVANTVLYSTLVDFQGWVENGNLALPDGVELIVSSDTNSERAGTVNKGSSSNPRYLARAINSYSGVYSGGSGSADNYSVLDDALSSNMITDGNSLTTSTVDTYVSGLNLIARFAVANTTYSSSSYESYYKNTLKGSNTQMPGDTVNKLTASAKIENWKKDAASILTADWFQADWNGANPGSVADGSGKYYVYNSNNNSGGFAPLAMYNYLNSDFTDSSVGIYSPRNTSSQMTAFYHRSVNIVGGGFLASILYAMHASTMLLCIGIVGIVYAFGLLFSMIGRGIRMLLSIPAAMLGTWQGMSKATVIIIMMIIEVLGTLFIYQIFAELFVALSTVFEGGMSDADTFVASTVLLGDPNAALLDVGNLGFLMFNLFFSIFYIFFTIKALKFRKSFIKAADEAASSIMSRLFRPTEMQPAANGQQAMGAANANRLGAAGGNRPPNAGGGLKGLAGNAAGGAAMAAGAGAARGLGSNIAGNLLSNNASNNKEGDNSMIDAQNVEIYDAQAGDNLSSVDMGDARRQQLGSGQGLLEDGSQNKLAQAKQDEAVGRALANGESVEGMIAKPTANDLSQDANNNMVDMATKRNADGSVSATFGELSEDQANKQTVGGMQSDVSDKTVGELSQDASEQSVSSQKSVSDTSQSVSQQELSEMAQGNVEGASKSDVKAAQKELDADATLQSLAGNTTVEQDEARAQAKKDANTQTLKEGAKTAVHAGEAVAHGMSGDVAGAVKSGTETVSGMQSTANAHKQGQQSVAKANANMVSGANTPVKQTATMTQGGGSRVTSSRGGIMNSAGVGTQRSTVSPVSSGRQSVVNPVNSSNYSVAKGAVVSGFGGQSMPTGFNSSNRSMPVSNISPVGSCTNRSFQSMPQMNSGSVGALPSTNVGSAQVQGMMSSSLNSTQNTKVMNEISKRVNQLNS